MDTKIETSSGLTPDRRARIRARFHPLWQAATPGQWAWRGATWGGLIALIVLLLSAAYGLLGHAAPARFLTGTAFLLAAFALLGGILTLLWRLLRAIPTPYIWVLACAVLVLALLAMTAMSVSIGILLVGLGIIVSASLLGAGLSGWKALGRQAASRRQRMGTIAALVPGLVGLAAGLIWLMVDGPTRVIPPNAAALSGAQVEPLALPDPSQTGSYPVRSLFYGSGTDRNRPEYGQSVDLITQPVDGSALVERWSSLRTSYWGFGPEALPINGRVWYPQGSGPFPLVVMVHGQHPMEDFSDGGYAYLGELLASRGFIVASVDENFLNLSPLTDWLIFHSLVGENDLRGWLLLEHLCRWRDWNRDPGSPFYGKVDLDQIALIGHSRGGEAVAIAAAFNRLPYAPDNAELHFDYNFNIRAVVGIAPVDGTYRPAGRKIVLENVSYLVLHGAHDMDVFTFQGDRQYERVHFTGGGDGFKAAVYIDGANHGQFNTVWGRKDLFEPVMRVFNLAQLMPGEAQRQIARVTLSAFLEATLHGQSGYRALFQDLRRGDAWLPDTIYLNQYQDARTQLVSAYEEDIDLTTTTLPGGALCGENLTVWREQPIRAKWESLENQAVYLGWDTAEKGESGVYAVHLPPGILPLDGDSILVFSLADAKENPAPGRPARPEGNRALIDLTVEVVDRAGKTARLPLSHFSLLQPQLEGRLGKSAFFSPFPASEAVLQHFEFPLQDFAIANPDFIPAELAEIRFVFDRTPAGVIILDAIGFQSGESSRLLRGDILAQ